ncbi:hypothetical protein CsatB_008361 [Cannabis sativa]|uniref:WW domain-containing protein n=3 Tax=Cannabis sativa TaxID=3483 RepID=A0AB40EBE3_CANSA|nr:hypothetical protein G4B88_002743 [Cannabis sativa]
MVSVQAPNQRKVITPEAKNNSSQNKRIRWEDHDPDDQLPFNFEKNYNNKRSKNDLLMAAHDIELHLETPLPSEWQRCLDIQSGKIHFYNTKTETRTCMDPRESTTHHDDQPLLNSISSNDNHHHGHMISLDLELNLTTTSESSPIITKKDDQYFTNINSSSNTTTTDLVYNNNNDLSNSAMEYYSSDRKIKKTTRNTSSSGSWPSWLAFETAADEMVATVCMRCHMLVMLCRSSPSCPNCKFMHSSSEKNLLKL